MRLTQNHTVDIAPTRDRLLPGRLEVVDDRGKSFARVLCQGRRGGLVRVFSATVGISG
jgi:hypothetical protein